ncbi:hypothetical protein AK830_g12414, partial [Neonectria ditissima]
AEGGDGALGDAAQRRRRGPRGAVVEDVGGAAFQVKVQQAVVHAIVEEVAAHQRRPREARVGRRQLLAPPAHQVLVAVQLQQPARVGARGVAAAEVGRHEALDARERRRLGEPQVLRDVDEREAGDDGVLAGEGGRQPLQRHVVRDGDLRDRVAVRRRRLGRGALGHADGEVARVDEAVEQDGAEVAVAADEADLVEGHGDDCAARECS